MKRNNHVGLRVTLEINVVCKCAAVSNQRNFSVFMLNMLLGSWKNWECLLYVLQVICRVDILNFIYLFIKNSLNVALTLKNKKWKPVSIWKL